MSKLRAEITYNHRLHNNPLFIEQIIDSDDTNQDPAAGNIGNINDPANNLVLTEDDDYSEESDDEVDEPQLENEFGEYLQGWVEMLEMPKIVKILMRMMMQIIIQQI
jgi:hypothetical protein